jgi:protein-tyrosine phosphatase
LAGAWNFRDVATLTGIKPGRLFRSSELSRLDDSGREALSALGITDVADLRSPQELERRGPGAVPAEVDVHLLPFPDLSGTPDDSAVEAPHESKWRKMMESQSEDADATAAAVAFMIDEYTKFPTLAGAQRAVRQVFSLLADDRPVLAHCFAGKDRTGFTIAIVLEAIGIPRDAILADFLRSNDAVPQLRERIMESVRERSGETPEIVAFAEARLTDDVLGVRTEYLDTARRVIDDNFGGLEGFLAAAGVTARDVERVRNALLNQ